MSLGRTNDDTDDALECCEVSLDKDDEAEEDDEMEEEWERCDICCPLGRRA
jgi:hypothetical protein